MISVIEKFRRWLNPDQVESMDTDLHISNYLNIVNSSKYADSNSNTEALERLIRLTAGQESSLIKSAQSEGKKTEDAEKDSSDDPETLKALEPIINDIEKLDIDPVSDFTGPVSGKNRHAQFRNQFGQHLELMKELEDEAVLHGQPCYQPPKFGRHPGVKFQLRAFIVPNYIYEAIDTNNLDILNINETLGEKNYRHIFQTLLWVEEMHQAIELRRYDMEDVLLAKYQNFFLVPVPGLAEGRPSLLRGDKLILKSSKRGTLYEAYIHDVRSKDVLVKLHSSLHSSDLDGLRFEVRFMSSRTCFRRCHHGVQQYVERPETNGIVFPKPEQAKMQKPMIDVRELTADNLRCFLGSLNIHQRKAVIGILQAESRPAPYIIFGPPGTGKTVTLVESILQVYSRMPSSRILVCGNSNSCVDVLAQRILDSKVIPQDQIIRLSAFYRMERLIPPGLESVTMDMDSISPEMYANCRIVITTCIQAGALNDFQGRFNYLFLDEAGHSSEPEALIPLTLLKWNGCMVLAGDPHQLGPVVMSPIASKYGLGLSFLERLSKLEVYKRKESDFSEEAYDARYITKLLISYRCDPRVLMVNNSLFYNNELQFTKETPKHWLSLLSLENPLVFHGIKGKDRREYINPSWFNPSEAITCLTYVKRLYAGGLKADQLGIITPYRRQIHKLNLLFDGCNLARCKIATMEEFQGDEREVIIISTVRTRKSNMQVDKKFNLGFLFNEKRFNVGVSRAMWLVIVIGDPDVLKGDTCWSLYMEKAQCIGQPPTTKQSMAMPKSVDTDLEQNEAVPSY